MAIFPKTITHPDFRMEVIILLPLGLRGCTLNRTYYGRFSLALVCSKPFFYFLENKFKPLFCFDFRRSLVSHQ